MHKIYALLRQWLLELLDAGPSPDPLGSFSTRELADLPTHHPATDRCLGA